MDDLVSRQAAIDIIEQELDGGTPYDIPSKIEHMPSAPQWIPCSERLPKDDDKYLVVTIEPFGEVEIAHFARDLYKLNSTEFPRYKGISSFYQYDAEYEEHNLIPVTHWMPLPEPPRSEG